VERRFEEVEHTADMALRVRGRDMAELFTNAAAGMFDLLVGQANIAPILRREVTITGPDYETLLVGWLSRLLYFHELNDEAYSRFSIQSLSPTELRAIAEGANSVPTKKTIKAVTFHDLAIHPTPNGYEATIVFDV
jgi:SHS2 domain-containing protein